ncbi:repeat-containing 5-like [Octopus vulgaris]|uniref:Repeat-containing 5-like n=1 Tax=Octopus vulgaris TaxID=6645 RepID=A0AA36C2M5_OCTVU|nr:repeat-containing 5-like [Octopus vulgaris]
MLHLPVTQIRFRALDTERRNDYMNILIASYASGMYWDDRNPRSFRHFTGPHICGDSLAIDASTNQILTGSWRRTNILQIWDFLTGSKIHNVPQDMDYTSSLYCAQWLGEDSIVSGGSSRNMAQVHNRTTFNVIGKLTNLPKAVYCIDNDHLGADTTIAIGFDCYIYLVRSERMGELRATTPEIASVRAYSVNNDFCE